MVGGGSADGPCIIDPEARCTPIGYQLAVRRACAVTPPEHGGGSPPGLHQACFFVRHFFEKLYIRRHFFIFLRPVAHPAGVGVDRWGKGRWGGVPEELRCVLRAWFSGASCFQRCEQQRSSNQFGMHVGLDVPALESSSSVERKREDMKQIKEVGGSTMAWFGGDVERWIDQSPVGAVGTPPKRRSSPFDVFAMFLFDFVARENGGGLSCLVFSQVKQVVGVFVQSS